MSAAPAMPLGDETMRDTTRNEAGKLSPGKGYGEHPEGKSSATKVVPKSSSEALEFLL